MAHVELLPRAAKAKPRIDLSSLLQKDRVSGRAWRARRRGGRALSQRAPASAAAASGRAAPVRSPAGCGWSSPAPGALPALRLSPPQDIAGFEGYETTPVRQLLYYAAGVATAGLLFLLAHWYLDLKLRLLLRPCRLQRAQYVVVTVRGPHWAVLGGRALQETTARCCARALLACSVCSPCPRHTPCVQLVDRRRELVRVHRMPALCGVSVSADARPPPATHVLCEEEHEEEHEGGALKGGGPAAGGSCGDGFDRMLEYRCGRYLYSEAQATFLPIPGLPSGFGAQLHRVASSRGIQGGWPGAGAGSRQQVGDGGRAGLWAALAARMAAALQLCHGGPGSTHTLARVLLALQATPRTSGTVPMRGSCTGPTSCWSL